MLGNIYYRPYLRNCQTLRCNKLHFLTHFHILQHQNRDIRLHQHSKCYDNITATICALKPQTTSILPEIDKWSVYKSLPNTYILHRIKNGKVEYSPLFCIKLRVKNYKHYSFNTFNEIDDSTFGGAVKKQRIEKHLTIKQVADYVGISVDTLMRLEQNKYDLHNADKLRKLCNILNLYTQKICSPYQLFLMNNQGEQILKFRKDNHLTQKQLAELLNTDRQVVSRYENNINPMPYELWVKFNSLN